MAVSRYNALKHTSMAPSRLDPNLEAESIDKFVNESGNAGKSLTDFPVCNNLTDKFTGLRLS